VYADTGGDVDPEPVLRAAATTEYHARETFAEWADDERHDAARGVYEATAAEEGEHYGLVTQKLDGEHEPGETPAMQEHLRGIDDTAGRAGGFVGWAIAAERGTEQLVGFFVGQADAGTTQLFRDLGEDVDAQLDRGRDLLAAVCETDDGWARAREAAGDAIQAAQGEYTERLEGTDVSPEPVD
jgi:hypothetical protein